MAQPKGTASNRVPEIRTGDTVVVLHGKDAGKRGRVDRVLRNRETETKASPFWRRATTRPVAVVIAGVNIAKRHTKPRQTMSKNTQAQLTPGGIVEKPMPIDASNVMLVCPRCDRVTRVKHERLGSGQSVRVCGHCREQLEPGE